MHHVIYPLLLTSSFLATKLVGLQRAVDAFRRLGGVLSRVGLPWRRKPAALVEARIARAYAYLPLAIKCLDQSLVTWFLLNLHGHGARMKIGMSLAPLESHAWVVLGERHFVDAPNIPDLHVVAEFPSWATA